MRLKFLCGLMGLVLTSPVMAQQDDSAMVKKMADDILSNAKAYDNLRYLCKEIGPRLSGSPRAARAVDATARMLKEAGADTVYLQPCMVPHWIRGEKEKGFINLPGGKKYDLHLCALGNTEGTGKKGVTAEVVEVTTMEALDKLGAAGVKGKIVFFNFPMDPTYIRTFNAYSKSGIGRREGPAHAAKYGAVAVMVRSLASNPDDYPHTGWTHYNDSFPKIPAFAVSTNDADFINKQLASNKNLTAYLRNTSTMLPDAPSNNVVGEIKGSEFPNEIITVGGHLDSWDLGEGAQDDGAGIVQSIELIRTMKALGIRPKRTIRAVMFMNEENGGRGGEKYLELAKAGNEKHLFALESDAGGFTPRGFSLEMTAAQKNTIRQWQPLLAPYGVYDFFEGGGGSDIGPLKQLGTALAGLSPDSQRYFDMHHASTDVFEIVSRRELHLGAFAMTALIYLVDKYGL